MTAIDSLDQQNEHEIALLYLMIFVRNEFSDNFFVLKNANLLVACCRLYTRLHKAH